MSVKINLLHRNEWNKHGLLKYSELIDQPITKCNTGQDESGEYGEWYFVPEAPLPSGRRVIYYAYFGAHLPREDAPWIFAELFDPTDDELAEYTLRVQQWQGQPERDPQP
ncbi:hypothetical protein J0H58_12740 [bacterium]|nr:hypothetical protein [bacterium]